MDRRQIEDELRGRFLPRVAARHDVVFALTAPDAEPLVFAIADGSISFEPDRNPDVTMMFDSPATAIGIIRGDVDPIAAFMRGEFRSDGHLLLVFLMIRIFAKGEWRSEGT